MGPESIFSVTAIFVVGFLSFVAGCVAIALFSIPVVALTARPFYVIWIATEYFSGGLSAPDWLKFREPKSWKTRVVKDIIASTVTLAGVSIFIYTKWGILRPIPISTLLMDDILARVSGVFLFFLIVLLAINYYSENDDQNVDPVMKMKRLALPKWLVTMLTKLFT